VLNNSTHKKQSNLFIWINLSLRCPSIGWDLMVETGVCDGTELDSTVLGWDNVEICGLDRIWSYLENNLYNHILT